MISIITVSHGHSTDVCNLVRSLSKFMNIDFEFILIDNINSKYDFQRLCEENKINRFSIIKNISPMSFSYNNNIGASLARSENIVFLNPDISLIDYSLPRFLTNANINDGLYFPSLQNMDGSPQVHGKKKPNFIDQVLTFIASSFRVKRESPPGDYWFFAAALICKKEFFYKLGGFDLGFPMYAEDAELCDRARYLGFPVKKLDSIKLKHGLGGNSKNKHIFKAVYSGFYFQYKSYLNKKRSRKTNMTSV